MRDSTIFTHGFARFLFPALIGTLAVIGPAGAQTTGGEGDASPTAFDGPAIDLGVYTVIGSKDNVERLPGSGTFLDYTDIQTFYYDDINQVIRRTPGVYMRQEDGHGLFPNISLRGVSTTRNSKLTIMEDGVLMAPASYSDPAAYYSPNAGRMSGLEILKGSSQIRFGPETTGGVVNYLSTPIPAEDAGYLSIAHGSNGDLRVHGNYGGRIDSSWATVGYLIEHVHRQTDGFKRIDGTSGGGYRGSKDTGFRRNEPLAKLRFDLKTSVPQSLEFKYGRTDIHADETYLGLTDPDFRADPFRRYAASRFDAIDTEQNRYSVRYAVRPGDDLDLNLTAYKTDFARNWYKLAAAGEGSGGAFRNLGEALAGEHGPGVIAVLKGDAAGRLRVRANNRKYGAEGLEAQVAWRLAAGEMTHQFTAGVRWHEDFVDRFQWDDVYTQESDGHAAQTTAGIPGTQDNRRAESEALAFYLQDRIEIGRLAVTPGVRFERIDYTNVRRSTSADSLDEVTSVTRGEIDYVAPGIGATWRQSEQLTWLAGAYRGVSPPGPGGAAGGLTEERSLGFETGARYNNRSNLSAEVILFHTAFDDLIVEQNAGGGGGAGETSNIGEVDTTGVELALAYDPAAGRDWEFRNPWNLSFTWTRARLGNDVNATGNGGGTVESIFSGGRKGNELPYIPEFQISLGTGIEAGAWGIHLDTFYQPSTYASANNSTALVNPDASTSAGDQPARDSRYGRVDAFLLVDVAAYYRLSERTRLKAACTNALDWEYIASRVPIGPRPGPPRTWTVGLETNF